jgi:hypothetical protein
VYYASPQFFLSSWASLFQSIVVDEEAPSFLYHSPTRAGVEFTPPIYEYHALDLALAYLVPFGL